MKSAFATIGSFGFILLLAGCAGESSALPAVSSPGSPSSLLAPLHSKHYCVHHDSCGGNAPGRSGASPPSGSPSGTTGPSGNSGNTDAN
ncbi:MAG TPA: hypothetical protein VME66_03095 [Candidatus Acidoferrales bacterium]|nr:hypothetical protein [Candidatus Acidoferrales bacterium]